MLFVEGRVLEFPVITISEKDIVDTNGAGDAFVGGTLHLFIVIYRSRDSYVCNALWVL